MKGQIPPHRRRTCEWCGKVFDAMKGWPKWGGGARARKKGRRFCSRNHWKAAQGTKEDGR